MRIVHVTTGFLGYGLSHKEHMLATVQAALGHEVGVLAARIGRSSWTDAIRVIDPTKDHAQTLRRGEERRDGVGVRRLQPLWHYADLYWCRGVRQAVTDLRADLWHLHEPAHGLPVQVADLIRRTAPIVIDQHQYTVSFSGRWWVEAEYRLVRRHLVDRAYRWADAVVSVTNGGRDFLRTMHRLDPRLVTVIPLGVRTDVFQPREEWRRRQRAALGLRPDDVLLINTGSLLSFKRHDHLLQGFARAVRRVPSLRLLMVGGGSTAYVKKLRRFVESLSVANRVFWRPPAPEPLLAEYFNAADVAIWPLFPTISISQAIACGAALVLSEHPSQNHFLEYGCGLGYRPGDIDAMANRFVTLATDAAQRESFRRHNIEFARNHLSPKAIARRYDDVYAQAIARHRAQATGGTTPRSTAGT